MKQNEYKLVQIVANTRFSLSKLLLLELFENSSEGREGLEYSLLKIIESFKNTDVYEYSLRIDAEVLAELEDASGQTNKIAQSEISAFLTDLRELMLKHNQILPEGKPLYIGLMKPNILILGSRIHNTWQHATS